MKVNGVMFLLLSTSLDERIYTINSGEVVRKFRGSRWKREVISGGMSMFKTDQQHEWEGAKAV